MKKDIKDFVMNKYLSFEDSEDRIYSNPDSELERDSNYAMLGRLDRAGLAIEGAADKVNKWWHQRTPRSIKIGNGGVNRDILRHERKKKNREVAAEKARLKAEATEKARKDLSASTEAKKEELAKRIKGNAEASSYKRATKDAIKGTEGRIKSEKQNQENIKYNKESRRKWAHDQVEGRVAKHASKAGIGGAVAGGALGVGAGHLATKSARKELAALTAKGINSDADRERADQLRRKIERTKVAAGAIGAVGGLIAGRRINRVVATKKGNKAVAHHLRNGTANYHRKETLNRRKYLS